MSRPKESGSGEFGVIVVLLTMILGLILLRLAFSDLKHPPDRGGEMEIVTVFNNLTCVDYVGGRRYGLYWDAFGQLKWATWTWFPNLIPFPDGYRWLCNSHWINFPTPFHGSDRPDDAKSFLPLYGYIRGGSWSGDSVVLHNVRNGITVVVHGKVIRVDSLLVVKGGPPKDINEIPATFWGRAGDWDVQK